jgi:hypothetical protein
MAFDAPLHDTRLIARKDQLVGILELLCQSLELTEAQFELAKKRYEGVGSGWRRPTIHACVPSRSTCRVRPRWAQP